MRTPKEILLQRHKAVEPKLNVIRQNAVATLDRRDWAKGWREFVFSMRWHLAGLSAVWMVVLVLNLDSFSAPVVRIAEDKIPPARELFAALLKNRREIIELTEAPAASEPAALPPRRSENRSTFEMV